MRIDADDAHGVYRIDRSIPSRGNIVVCPTIGGLNPYISTVADRLAASGHPTFVIDYHPGEPPPVLNSIDQIVAAIDRLSDPAVVAQVDAARRWLVAETGSDSPRVGVVGFCIGGTFAFHAACGLDEIACATIYYGSLDYADGTAAKPRAPTRATDALKAPILAHFGTSDHFVPPAQVDAFETALVRSGKSFELCRYPGAPHAFDEDAKSSFRPVASATAWQRTIAFNDWHIAGIAPR